MTSGFAEGGAHPVVRARELVAVLADRAIMRELETGDFAHIEGDDAETVSVVLEGQLLFEGYPPSSWTPTPIGVVGPGNLIGEEALGGGHRVRMSTVRCLTPSRMMVVYRDELIEIITAKAVARRLVFSMVADRVHLSNKGALASSATSADVRIARWLLHMHEVFGNPSNPTPDIAATQEHLAGLAGTRRPTANKVLQALQRDDLIALGRGRVRVTDALGLDKWLEQRSVDAP